MTVLTSSIDANLVDAALRAVLDDVDDLDGGNTSESGSFSASVGGQSISGTFLAGGRPIGSTDGGPVELLVFQLLAGGREFTLTDFSINSNLFVSAVEDDGFDGLLPLLFTGDDQIAGGALADSLQGGSGDDLIVALGGDDTLIGGSGADTLNGGGGADSLLGGGGGDTLLGGGGSDTARGGGGDDSLNGGGGQDELFGGGGADSLIGGGASDSLVGGGGDDLLNGAAGADSLTGGGGADSLIGGGGADTLIGAGGGDVITGGGGADILTGGAGADSLTGSGGADTLNGGVAADTLSGGGGADLFVFVDGDGADQINGFALGVDQADLSGVSTLTGFADLAGALVDTADGALLSYVGGSALFQGVSADALTAESFIF